ncbi:MAG: T9SS type A sorting domain-containing protein [Chitinispirillales bacterium]|jgi:hypothetical protein|nr:T9SS type A sorting domain-containing protein [Chitinispirillales bacterium]
MNFKKSNAAMIAAMAIASTATGGNYAFPSPWNPAGKSASEINQFVTIIWDDNQYSGIGGSYYEPQAGAAYASVGRVNGVAPQANPTDTWTNKNNPLEIWEEGKGKKKYGIMWTLENIGKERAKPVPMTFQIITGLFANTWVDKKVEWSANPTEAVAWQRAQSALGYWTGQEMGTNLPDGDDPTYWPVVPDKSGYLSVPVAWGREMRTGINPAATEYAQQNFITQAFDKVIAHGIHELGIHTIDHFETNSPLGDGQGVRNGLPGFYTITGGDLSRAMSTPYTGPGARVGDEETPWGVVYNQVDEYGTRGHALIRGWRMFAGRIIEQDIWKNYIDLARYWLTKPKTDKEGGLGYSQSKIFGFRAPRLEINSAAFYALKELDLVYDCSLEEGYEDHVDGYNFLWPYTTDNGQRNSWTQLNMGERVFIDTMPVGLWEIPVTCFLVPKDIRGDVVANWNAINNGKPASIREEPMDASTWDGKVTGFDFNAWILFGMDSIMFKRTMENSLDRRMAGNKAPMEIGAHNDYHTPIYDNGTLLNDFNRSSYGLVVTNKWNTWETRQRGMEEFVDYALAKGAIFLTAKALIDSLSVMNDAGEDRINDAKSLNDAEFVGYVNGKVESGLGTFNGASGIEKEFDAKAGIENNPTYVYEFDAGTFANMTHISLEYKSRTATCVKLVMEDGGYREVILAHRYSPIGIDGHPSDSYESGSYRNSGKIPLTSFDFPAYTYYEGVRNYSSIDPAKIVAIEISPLAPENKTPLHGETPSFSERKADYPLKYAFKNVTVYSGERFVYDADDLPDNDSKVALETVKGAKGARFAVAGISANSLRLSIAAAGKYDVKVFGVNGRLLQSFNAQSLASGINTLKLNNLAKGVYIIKVQGINTKRQLTKSALVL